MKVLHVELPDKIAEEIEGIVQSGWFQSEDELVRLAVSEFIRNRRLELLEQFQREDIAWALQQKADSP